MKHFRLAALAIAVIFAAAMTTLAYCQEKEPTKTGNQPKTAGETEQPSTTEDNLQTGFTAEDNASQRYSAYATKADEEGYHQVASMFRAIAKGEAVHAANIEKLIRQIGDTPAKDPEPLMVMSTRENLEFAEADQNYEAEVMYPAFIKQARKDKNRDAERVFDYALAAEPTHQTWYRQALEDLDGYRGENINFFVCPGCGMTERTMKESACPICSSPREKFEEVR